jgi:pimeloyl-ACP methyl ester carboxylesterase
MTSGGGTDGVVLLHGIARTSRSLHKMQRALEAAGFATLNLDYPSRRQPLQQLAESLHVGIDRFARGLDGRLHLVTHSMGGLLARGYLAQHRPGRLGRIVMLGPPNQGSEVADALKNLWPYRAFYGPAGQQLTTIRDSATEALLKVPACDIGIVAGNRTIDPIASRFLLPAPNDGRVSVESTKLDGMTDHVVIPCSHTFLLRNAVAIAQTIAFLRDGRFDR